MESVYQEGLAIELEERSVPFGREVDLPIRYKGQILACGYRADFICFDEVVVELKSIRELTEREQAQVIHFQGDGLLTRATPEFRLYAARDQTIRPLFSICVNLRHLR